MGGGDLKSFSVDMDTEFIFEKCLIGVKNLGIIRLILIFLFPDDFPDKFL